MCAKFYPSFPGGWFNIKMLTSKGIPIVEIYKMILELPDLHNGIIYTDKMTS